MPEEAAHRLIRIGARRLHDYHMPHCSGADARNCSGGQAASGGELFE